MHDQIIQAIAKTVIPNDDDDFSKHERQLLLALLYLVDAEADGQIVDTLPRCRQVLLETIKAASRRTADSAQRQIGLRFKAAQIAGKLSNQGLVAWQQTCAMPDLNKLAVSSLLSRLDR